MKVAITNLGTIVSGDWRSPFVQGDTVIAHDGKIVSAGTANAAVVEACDVVIDATPEVRFALPSAAPLSRNVTVPVGVPVAASTVAVSVTVEVTTAGFGAADNVTVEGCFTTCTSAGFDTLAALSESPV